MSRTRGHRPSRIPADGERFNDKLFVDLRDKVDVRGKRNGRLVAVDHHTDHTVIAPCPSRELSSRQEMANKMILQHQAAGVSCQLRGCARAEPKVREMGIAASNTRVWSAKGALRRTDGTCKVAFRLIVVNEREQLGRRFIILVSA